MTKNEELKVLEKIEELIKSAGEDSYIGPTFAGVVDICRNNIENDFLNEPVADLRAAREKSAELAKVALLFSEERDQIKADLDKLAAAYREAVKTIQAATGYVHGAASKRYKDLDAIPADAPDDVTCTAFRLYKKAQDTARKCTEVLTASERQPLSFAMQEA